MEGASQGGGREESEARLRQCLGELSKELTDGEYLRFVTAVVSDEWTRRARFMIQRERHPDKPDMPGELEGKEK